MEPGIVGANIKRLRKEKGLSQKELAEKLNVIDKTISRWECGYGLPDVNLLPEIAKIFGISIEELIGEESAKPVKPFPKKRAIVISSCVLAVVVASSIAIPLALRKSKKDAPALAENCWSRALASQSDYSLFTAFGAEEVMSLELDGDLQNGTFVCQESWLESNDADLLNCLVFGRYQADEGQICFYAEEVDDPNGTEKLRTSSQLGIPYFLANYEGDFASIHFLQTEKNSMDSAFGRWTKYERYFSNEAGSIDFERIVDGSFSEEQFQRMPSFALIAMGQIIPMELIIDTCGYPFLVGRKVDASSFLARAVYSDGHEEDVSGVASFDLEGKILTPEDALLHAEFSDGAFSLEAEVPVEPSFPYPWDLVESSKASALYFTHYLTESIKAFGMIELYGSQDEGDFLYSEAYGKQTFASFAVLRGTYRKDGSSLNFTVERTFSSKAKSDRFAANSVPYVCQMGEEGFLSFETSASSRTFFGYFSNTDNFDSVETTSFSRFNGEVYFEKVGIDGLSERAKEAIAAYGSMIVDPKGKNYHETIPSNQAPRLLYHAKHIPI